MQLMSALLTSRALFLQVLSCPAGAECAAFVADVWALVLTSTSGQIQRTDSAVQLWIPWFGIYFYILGGKEVQKSDIEQLLAILGQLLHILLIAFILCWPRR